jgi:hypothetical protein
LVAAFCLLLSAFCPPASTADEASPPPKPEIRRIEPQVLAAGGVRAVAISGQDLKPREITFAQTGIAVRIVAVEPNPGSDEAAKQRGNTIVKAEVTLPTDAPRDLLELTLTNEDGGKVTGKLLVDDERPEIEEVEPNDSLRHPQRLPSVPITVKGRIADDDADVFAFAAHAGETWSFTTQAARLGSTLDPVLRLRDARGIPLAVAVDRDKHDARLVFTVPTDGVYTIEIFDADNRNAPNLSYRLAIAITGR